MKPIVILINNRDIYHNVRRQVAFFLSLATPVYVILSDNESTYPPLLEWYDAGCPLMLGDFPAWDLSDLQKQFPSATIKAQWDNSPVCLAKFHKQNLTSRELSFGSHYPNGTNFELRRGPNCGPRGCMRWLNPNVRGMSANGFNHNYDAARNDEKTLSESLEKRPLYSFPQKIFGGILVRDDKTTDEMEHQWQTGLPVYDYMFLSDSDIAYHEIGPSFLNDLVNGLETYPVAMGAGVSLKIDDLPICDRTVAIRDHELQFWQHHINRNQALYHRAQPTGELDSDWYRADVDTAGVLRRRNWAGQYPGIRSVKWIATHLPWYFEKGNRPEDFQYYLDHADPAGCHWTAHDLENKT